MSKYAKFHKHSYTVTVYTRPVLIMFLLRLAYSKVLHQAGNNFMQTVIYNLYKENCILYKFFINIYIQIIKYLNIYNYSIVLEECTCATFCGKRVLVNFTCTLILFHTCLYTCMLFC